MLCCHTPVEQAQTTLVERVQRPLIERVQPWLGTTVAIRAYGRNTPVVHHAINQAFAEIRMVHRLMSFYSSESDVSELNRSAATHPVTVHSWTLKVLTRAVELSAASDGCFDVSAAHSLNGDWRDITLRHDGRVTFARPLQIDLGGIAKGFAVDRAVACLRHHGIHRGVVNAGGDLSVWGPEPELIRLRLDACQAADHAAVELSNGSAASSCGFRNRRLLHGQWSGPHIDAALGAPTRTDRFVCVLADECLLADALTKVVLARGANVGPLLSQFGAAAHFFDPEAGWIHLNEAAFE